MKHFQDQRHKQSSHFHDVITPPPPPSTPPTQNPREANIDNMTRKHMEAGENAARMNKRKNTHVYTRGFPPAGKN